VTEPSWSVANVFCFSLQRISAAASELATLADKLKITEQKLKKLEEHIANNDFAGTPYDDRAEAKAALKDLEADLRAQEADLRRLLILDKEEKARLQQHSGAGTSMLMCFEKPAMSLPKIVFVCIAWIRSSVCLQAAGAAYPQSMLLSVFIGCLSLYRRCCSVQKGLGAIQAAVTQVSHKVDTMHAAVSHDVDQKLDKRMKMSVTSCADVGRRVQDFSTIASLKKYCGLMLFTTCLSQMK
jgi:hypothetical protein